MTGGGLRKQPEVADRPDREGVHGPVLHHLERWYQLPPIRGSVEDLLEKNALIKNHVSKMEVKIRHTSVDLRHQFIPVPLVYIRDTCDLDFQEMNRVERDTGSLPVAGQSFNNFLDYNSRVRDLVRDAFPNSETYLDDPNLLLAVELVKTSTSVKGDNPSNTRLMTESTRQGYFVNLIRWVTETFEQETKDEMIRKEVPQVSASLSLIKRYTRNTRIV